MYLEEKLCEVVDFSVGVHVPKVSAISKVAFKDTFDARLIIGLSLLTQTIRH